MANPVFDKLHTQWSAQTRTPKGYPTMPGYTPGRGRSTLPVPANHTRNTWDQRAESHAHTPWPDQADQADQRRMEDTYRAPAADAVDRGVMTYDDIIVKSGLCLLAVLVSAIASWTLVTSQPRLGVALSGVGVLVGFVLAMVTTFSQKIRPALVIAYALAEGVALGALSAFFEFVYPGIVVQALIATAAVFAVTLALFASGKVRNSPKLMRFTLISLIGVLVYRLVSWGLSSFGLISAGGFDAMTFAGIPLGIVVGLFAVLVGAFSLIQDFDQARIGVENLVPARYAWACAFGILVTVVWMYVEILRLLALLRDN